MSLRVVPDPEPWSWRDFAAGFCVMWAAIAVARVLFLAVAGLLPKEKT